MIKKIALPILSLSISMSVFSGTMSDAHVSSSIPLSIGAYGGYGHVDGGYKQDGNVAQGRFALGLHVRDYSLHHLDTLSFGVEAGVQSGNTMRLSADQVVIDEAGGLPVQAILKPMVDALVTVKGHFRPMSPFSYVFKGGIAYRQLQFEDRTSSRDTLNKVNGEFQAGLGYSVTNQVTLTALYQGIYNTNQADVQPNSVGDLTISNIPTQQAGFLGIEYVFN